MSNTVYPRRTVYVVFFKCDILRAIARLDAKYLNSLQAFNNGMSWEMITDIGLYARAYSDVSCGR